MTAPAVDLKHRCRILRSRRSRGACRREGRARLRQVQRITDRGPGTCSCRRRGDEPTNPLDKRGPETPTHEDDTRTHQPAHKRTRARHTCNSFSRTVLTDGWTANNVTRSREEQRKLCQKSNIQTKYTPGKHTAEL